MNLLSKEIKSGLKPFLFWTLGLFMFVFAGIVKSSAAMADGQFMVDLISKFPRIVVAAMGMANVDISQFGGFYAVLMQYIFVLTAVYAAHLGSRAVSRESVDKTYEFLFTKPRSRSFILAYKLLAGLVFLTIYAALNFVFSTLAVKQLGLKRGLHCAVCALLARTLVRGTRILLDCRVVRGLLPCGGAWCAGGQSRGALHLCARGGL